MKSLIFMDTNIPRLQNRLNEFAKEHNVINTRGVTKDDGYGFCRIFVTVEYTED